jgi:hypothetical protein
MSSFRSSDASFARKSFTASICCSVFAAVVYAATLATYVFPGESARQLVQWTGIDVLAFPDHPVWGFFVRLFGSFGVLSSVAVADIAVSRIVPVFKAPRYALGEVPESAKTLVTVAALLTGGKGDKRIFESLERFRFMNPDENIYFCLLADLPDSKTHL